MVTFACHPNIRIFLHNLSPKCSFAYEADGPLQVAILPRPHADKPAAESRNQGLPRALSFTAEQRINLCTKAAQETRADHQD